MKPSASLVLSLRGAVGEEGSELAASIVSSSRRRERSEICGSQMPSLMHDRCSFVDKS